MQLFSRLRYENVREEPKEKGKLGKLVKEAIYEVQVSGDHEKHAGIAIIPRLETKWIPNSMVDLFRVIEEAGG